MQAVASGCPAVFTLGTVAADGQMLTGTYGNGVAETRGYDGNTGRLTTITDAAGGTGVMSRSYGFDALGNVLSRTDGVNHLTDSFAYDGLNRLTAATTGGAATVNYSYDKIGNLTGRSDFGGLTYGSSGGQGPHQLKTVSTFAGPGSYSYDSDGNMTSGSNRSYSWTSFDMPATLTAGSNNDAFVYGPNHERIKRIHSNGTTTTTTYYIAGASVERTTDSSSGIGYWNDYLSGAGGLVAQQTTAIGGTGAGAVSILYSHTDGLGSVSALSDAGATSQEQDSYDPWGQKRVPGTGGGDPYDTLQIGKTTKGFTGQEELAEYELVHLNGRIYDPSIGRFISADNVTQFPFSTQGWNSYAYCGNNPVNCVDPSGHSFWSNALSFFTNPLGLLALIPGVKHFEESFLRHNAWAGIALEAASVFCGPAAAACAAGTASYLSGVNGGKFGDMLKAGAIAYVTAEAFEAVGTATGFHNISWSDAISNPTMFAANIVGHAAIGCASQAASGGQCGAGALGAAFGAVAGPATNGLGFETGLVASSVSGGVGSVLGGGKFINGAETAAFGYLFNQAAAERELFRDEKLEEELRENDPLEFERRDPTADYPTLEGEASYRELVSSANTVQTFWPPNNGALGLETEYELRPGTVIDRFGYAGGVYFSPVDTPMEMRALPPTANTNLYTQYTVNVPFVVMRSTIAPAFNQFGLGTQYRASVSAAELVKQGVLTPR